MQGGVDLRLGTSPSVTAGLLVSVLRSSIQKNFGDRGAGLVQTTFSVKYFSPHTGTGIIRCHREAVDTVRAAMFFVTSVDGKPCVFSCVGVSGSIKKAELLAMRRARETISQAKRRGLLKGSLTSSGILSSLFEETKEEQEEE